MRRTSPRLALINLFVACLLPLAVEAKPEKWRDLQGNEFRGEPTEVFGPFAVFRTGGGAGRRLLLQQLSPADCVRVHARTADQQPRQDDWAQATRDTSAEVFRHTVRVRDGKAVPAELAGRAEPRVYLVFFADHGIGESWEMMGAAMGLVAELQQAFPGEVEVVFYGLRHDLRSHLAMATQMNLPWLVTDLYAQRSFRSLERVRPGEGYALFAVTRDGVPLCGDNNPGQDDVKRVLGELRGCLELAQPDDPRGWSNRLHYLRAVQPIRHPDSRAEPVLIGNPLRADALKQHGIQRVVATLEIAADGSVTTVELSPDSLMPPEFAPALQQALQKAPVVPAVEHGRFVAGRLTYRLEITP